MERYLLGTAIRFCPSITFSPRSNLSIAFGSSRPARSPEHIRSDNGPEFVAKAVQEWIGAVGAKTAYIKASVAGGVVYSKRGAEGHTEHGTPR
jgi:hypothetical protein